METGRMENRPSEQQRPKNHDEYRGPPSSERGSHDRQRFGIAGRVVHCPLGRYFSTFAVWLDDLCEKRGRAWAQTAAYHGYLVREDRLEHRSSLRKRTG